MGHERSKTEAGRELLARLRRAGERLGLLLAVLVSSLLAAASGPIGAGEGPIPIVEVKLTEFAIAMPTTVPPGPVAFSVTNAGTEEHNFEIEGQGVEKSFDADLKPGETRSLQVELPVGTYAVYCPVHKERRMRLELKVAQQRSEGATATSRGFRQALVPAPR
jgi:plastocyanin